MKQKTDTNKLVVLNPPPHRKTSIPLAKISDVRFEIAKLYREARTGKIDVQDATRLAYLLQVLGKIIETSEIEARISALEHQQEVNKR